MRRTNFSAFWTIATLAYLLLPRLPAEESKSLENSANNSETTPHAHPANANDALAYLELLVAMGDPQTAATALIQQLGDPDFSLREQATERLLQLSAFPTAQLEVAVQSDDAEIRWRSRMVLNRLAVAGNRRMFAALHTVRENPPPKIVTVLLQLAEFESTPSQQVALRDTLRTVVGEVDQAQLSSAAAAGKPPVRLAAAYALERLAPAQGRDALTVLLNESSERVACDAAKYLGNVGDRRSLSRLVALIGSDSETMAEEASCFLTALTGHEFITGPSDDPNARAARVASAQRWLAEHGDTADLTFPVPEAPIQRGNLAGNTLLATGERGFVVELDPTGKELWKFEITAWSAEKLTSGNVLIASYSSKRIVEITPKGKVVWEIAGVSAMRAKPLANGRVLVADFQAHRVVEFADTKEAVWQVKTPDNCFDVDRLPNGNTVFVCPNVVTEVDREGKTVRNLAIAGRANGVQVLPNGHWLIANFSNNAVEQYDREGHKVWEFPEIGPCDAFRLRNGKTLVVTSKRAIEISADRTTVRELAETRYGCARQ